MKEFEYKEVDLDGQRCVVEVRKRIDFSLPSQRVDLSNVAFGSSYNSSDLSSSWTLREPADERSVVGYAAHLDSAYRHDDVIAYHLIRLANGDVFESFVPRQSRKSTILIHNDKSYAAIKEFPVGTGWSRWLRLRRRWVISVAGEPMAKVDCGIHFTPKTVFRLEFLDKSLGQPDLPWQAGVVLGDKKSRRVIPENGPAHRNQLIKRLHFHVSMVFRLHILGLY